MKGVRGLCVLLAGLILFIAGAWFLPAAAEGGEHRWLAAGLSPVKVELRMPLACAEERKVFLTAVNLGDVPCEVEIRPVHPPTGVLPQGERVAPLEWVEVSPESAYLEPGRSEYVAVTLKPAADARGRYFAVVAAKASLPGGTFDVSTVSYSTIGFSVQPGAQIKRLALKYGPLFVLVFGTGLYFARFAPRKLISGKESRKAG
ncbi:hypothetical protein SAMN00808754_1581 [Thermanaeromonas toyohensis ToBE]|uniref:Alpha-galactosidase NEW3 domain-containing protein n=1 Tax=Thermanaeromonas toyohensis ToBE TaxID=698762 RepID=A0A1W1VTI5_9FIRM|nr:hypothetical protein [Thermanaeromonas toyohensis]SMB96669.1 hypothetical protein SAMN00808754_1581 [Thermanaeromonas toyohensis ToBE]